MRPHQPDGGSRQGLDKLDQPRGLVTALARLLDQREQLASSTSGAAGLQGDAGQDEEAWAPENLDPIVAADGRRPRLSHPARR